MNISTLMPDDIETNWHLLEPLISPALDNEHEELTALDIKDMLENGQMSLLYVDDGSQVIAVQTFEILEKENYKLMNLVTTCGVRMDEWLNELDEHLTNIGREIGCKYLHTRGRIGWLKVLKQNGYNPLYFVAEKKIEGIEHGR